MKEDGFLYFIDKDGDVSRAKMVRRGKGTRRKAANEVDGPPAQRAASR